MTNQALARSLRSFLLLVVLFLLSVACISAQSMFRKVSDFDGDGRADYAVVRAKGGTLIWHILQSRDGYRATRWGITGYDTLAAGDYDGDGKTDVAVYREMLDSMGARYSFYILGSQTGAQDSVTFTDSIYNYNAPKHQDYDGDSKMDPAANYGEYGLFLPLRIRLSFSGGAIATVIVPPSTSVLRLGDIDGDGRAELAYHKNGVLNLMNYDGSNPRTINISFSFPATMVAADFDGDGKGEIATYDGDGTWFWIRSSDGVFQSTRFGTSGDIPVPADYDGDGKTDQAIWRPGAQSNFWVKGSQAGLSIVPWGVSTDKVVKY